jgi:hypothetical protein
MRVCRPKVEDQYIIRLSSLAFWLALAQKMQTYTLSIVPHNSTHNISTSVIE